MCIPYESCGRPAKGTRSRPAELALKGSSLSVHPFLPLQTTNPLHRIGQMGLPKAFLRLPTPTSLLKPAGVPRRLASAAPHIHLSHPPSTSLSALRLLARRLFSTVPPVARLPTPPAPRDLASKVRLHASPRFHPAAQQARRFGPGGLGRGPMGPGVKSGFAGGRSVANVGLGQARGYASAARPLLDNFVSNAPRSFASLLSVLLPHCLADPFRPSLPPPL